MNIQWNPSQLFGSKLIDKPLGGDRIGVEWYVGGKPSLQLDVDTATARQAKKHQYLLKDTEFCLAMIESLLEMHDTGGLNVLLAADDHSNPQTQSRALYTASVITYGRLFSSVGPGRLQLNWRKVFDKDGSKFAPFHEWIMQTHRHGYVAHSNDGPLETARVVHLFPGSFDSRKYSFVSSYVNYQASPSRDDLAKFRRLVQFVRQWILIRQKRLIDRVLLEASALPPNQRYQQATYKHISPVLFGAPSPPIPD